MTNRREFLQVAAISAAAPIAARAGDAATAAGLLQQRTALALGGVVIDSRHAQSRAFGEHVAGRAPLLTTHDGDMTALWLADIAPAWSRKPVALAGLTEAPALFCLEQLAWSHGLRVVFHAEHVLRDGAVRHSVLRGAGLADLGQAELAAQGARWPQHLAAALTRRDSSQCLRAGPSCAGLMPQLPGDAQLLTSWIIAAA